MPDLLSFPNPSRPVLHSPLPSPYVNLPLKISFFGYILPTRSIYKLHYQIFLSEQNLLRRGRFVINLSLWKLYFIFHTT